MDSQVIFFGTHENKVDRKGRVSVPSLFRQALAQESQQGIVVYPSLTGVGLEGCAHSYFNWIGAHLDKLGFLSREKEVLTKQFFPKARPLQWDGTGRVQLPADLLAKAGIEDTVYFCGMYRVFRLLSPADYESFLEADDADLETLDSLLTRREPEGGSA